MKTKNLLSANNIFRAALLITLMTGFTALAASQVELTNEIISDAPSRGDSGGDFSSQSVFAQGDPSSFVFSGYQSPDYLEQDIDLDLNSDPSYVRFSPDGNRLLVRSEDNTVYYVNSSPQDFFDWSTIQSYSRAGGGAVGFVDNNRFAISNIDGNGDTKIFDDSLNLVHTINDTFNPQVITQTNDTDYLILESGNSFSIYDTVNFNQQNSFSGSGLGIGDDSGSEIHDHAIKRSDGSQIGFVYRDAVAVINYNGVDAPTYGFTTYDIEEGAGFVDNYLFGINDRIGTVGQNYVGVINSETEQILGTTYVGWGSWTGGIYNNGNNFFASVNHDQLEAMFSDIVKSMDGDITAQSPSGEEFLVNDAGDTVNVTFEIQADASEDYTVKALIETGFRQFSESTTQSFSAGQNTAQVEAELGTGSYTFLGRMDSQTTNEFRTSNANSFSISTVDINYNLFNPANNSEFGEGSTVNFEADVSPQNLDLDTAELVLEYPDNTTNVLETFNNISSGTTETFNVTSSQLNQGGEYEWYIRSTDSQLSEPDISPVRRFTVVENPEITNWNVNPNPSDVLKGEEIDINLEGLKGTYDIDTVNIEFRVDGTVEETRSLSGATVTNNGGFNYSESNFTQMIDAWEGSNLEFEVTVNDTQGNTVSSLVDAIAPHPPNDFNFIRPDDQEVFIDDGSGSNVQFDYGVDLDSGQEGTAILNINGIDVDSTSVDSNFNEGTYSNEYFAPSELNWIIVFQDQQGNEFTSGLEGTTSDDFRTVYVREAQAVLNLLQPDGDDFQVDFDENRSVSHTFEIDSQGSDNFNYYYEFVLNDQNGTVFSKTSNTISGGNLTQYNETVNNLGEGDYEWIVRVFNASDDSQIQSQSQFYTVSEPPTFSLNIDHPPDGATINRPVDQNTVDTDINYTVTPETEDVSTTLFLNGDPVQSQTVTTNEGATSFTYNANGLTDGNYDLQLQGEDDAFNTEFVESSFTVSSSDMFNLSIDSPNDGEQIQTPLDSNTTDVNTSYSVNVGSGDLNTSLTLNGDVIETRNFGASDHNTNQQFNLTLDNLEEQEYNLELTGEDQYGNTLNRQVTFSVIPDDEPPTVEEIRVTPELQEAVGGDFLDIYFRGSENSDPVEYVNVTLFVNGTQEKTEQIPRSELVIGSFQKTLSDWIQVEQTWTNLPVEIVVDAVDSTGRVGSSQISFILGEDQEPQVRLAPQCSEGVSCTPDQNDDIYQVDGNAEDVEFRFELRSLNDPADWQFRIRERSQENFTTLEDTTIQATEGDWVERARFYDLNNLFNQQFGDYEWEVQITETSTSETNTAFGQFSIVEENTSVPAIDFKQPYNHQTFTIPREEESGAVEMNWDYDVRNTDSAQVSLKVDGDTISLPQSIREVGGSGESSYTVNGVEVGQHTATLKIKREDGATDTVTSSFSVENNPPPENGVFVRNPQNQDTLYQDNIQNVQWAVRETTKGETSFVIEDDAGNVVRNFTGEDGYNKPDELLVYNAVFDGNVSIGNYQGYGQLFLDDGRTVESERVNFTVVDRQAPELTGITAPSNNTVIQEGNDVSWNINTETFEDAADVQLTYRPVGSLERTLVANFSQSSSTQRQVEANQSIPPGRYAWNVRFQINPVFISDTYYFTVESTEIQEPQITLTSPEQDDSFTPAPANVTFDYSVEVFSSGDSTSRLLVSRNESGLDNFTAVQTDQQNVDDGNVNYQYTEELEADAYFWKVQTEYPNGTEFTTDEVGFSVGENQTAPQPGGGEEPSEGNFLTGAFAKSASFVSDAFSGLGSTALFITASIITMLSGVLTSRWTNHSELSILVAATSALTFVFLGWFEAWVGVILFLIAAGIFIFALRRTHGGM